MGSLGSDHYYGPLNGNPSNGPNDKKPDVVLDPEDFRRQGYMAVDLIADYYKDVEKYPVRSQVEPGYLRKIIPETAPTEPEPMEAILYDIRAHIVPGLTHWMSPNYFAYFPSSGSTAGFMGEALAAGFNVVGFNWASSPAATELESLVMDWLGKALGLPEHFLFSAGLGGGGVLQGTTCEAVLCTVVAARDRALRDGASLDSLTVYCSDQTHCSFKKAAQIAGITMRNFRVVPTSRETAFAMQPRDLRAAIEADEAAGLHPTFVLTTVGTTSTAAVDPLAGLCSVAAEKGREMWVHVDAAYAGSACLVPEYRHFIDGVETATSFSFNAHKWMFTQQDCCCMWVRDSSLLVQSLSTDPEYLRNKATESKLVVDYKDWQVALSRRFRSLKLWMVLRSYGIRGIQAALRRHVDMAKKFEALVEKDKRFEVFVPRYFAAVCFRLAPTAVPGGEDVNEVNKRLLDDVNESGEIYMTHSVVEGVYVIRFVVGSTLTTDESYVVSAWKAIQRRAQVILTLD